MQASLSMRAGLGLLSLGPQLHPGQCCSPVFLILTPPSQRKGISPRPTVTSFNVHEGLTCSRDSAPKHACFRQCRHLHSSQSHPGAGPGTCHPLCFSWDLPSLSSSRSPTPEDRGLRALSQAERGQLLPTQHLCDSMRSCPDRAPPEEPAHTPSAFSPREAWLLLRRGAADPVGPSPPVPEGGRYREHPQERQTSTEQTLVQKALGTRLVSG